MNDPLRRSEHSFGTKRASLLYQFTRIFCRYLQEDKVFIAYELRLTNGVK